MTTKLPVRRLPGRDSHNRAYHQTTTVAYGRAAGVDGLVEDDKVDDLALDLIRNLERSRTERARRSSLVTTNWSPSRMNVRAFRSASRSSRLAPLFFSSKIFSQPWVLSLSNWVSRFCPTVETRAYQIFMGIKCVRE